MTGAVAILSEKISGGVAVKDRPERKSFEEFLLNDARVPVGGGLYGPYTFKGREAVQLIVQIIDEVLAKRFEDFTLGIAGGAQWGKTILELNLAAYCTSQLFLNVGLFMPDNDLAAGIIDAKFRPDVIDQIPWFASMIRVGKEVNKSGKSVDRKGAFLVNDGRRRAQGLVWGLKKIPTTFSLDVAEVDEVDDVPVQNLKFVGGRLTASKLRFQIRIGTMRVHGRGQNKVFTDGSQGVIEFSGLNMEDEFPGIIRCAATGTPRLDDPKLTWTGDFRRDDAPIEIVAMHKPGQRYYIAHPKTGESLDMYSPTLRHRKPERVDQNNVTVRISQLSIPAIGLSQIVGQFQKAVRDPQEMTVFRCDVLALPQSTAQSIGPAIIQRAQAIAPFESRITREGDRPVFAGIDTGDKCYFWATERESARRKRLIFPTTIAAGDLVARGVSLFNQLGVQCLGIDQRPLVSQARTLALILNGIDKLPHWPAIPDSGDAWISLPGGLTWDGHNRRWTGARCFVVRFDKKSLGAGIEHGFDIFEENGVTKFVPLLRCNRYETIDRALTAFLTPLENVVQVIDGTVREEPAMLLPTTAGCKAMEDVAAHIITGSERSKEKDDSMGDYVDKCDNHYLLADAYSALVESEASHSKPFSSGQFGPLKVNDRFARGMEERRERSLIG